MEGLGEALLRLLRPMLAPKILGHALQQGTDGTMYAMALHGFVGHPYQSDVYGLCAWEDVVDDSFLEAVGFAQLSLGAVSVNGMAQAAFGYADQHLDWRLAIFGLYFSIDDTHGENGGRAAASGEEAFDFAEATEVFGFFEGESHGVCVGCSFGKRQPRTEATLRPSAPGCVYVGWIFCSFYR